MKRPKNAENKTAEIDKVFERIGAEFVTGDTEETTIYVAPKPPEKDDRPLKT